MEERWSGNGSGKEWRLEWERVKIRVGKSGD